MNSWAKSLIVSLIAAIAASADAFANGSTAPGIVAYVASHPQAPAIAAFVAYVAHNLISELFPPDPMKAVV